MKKTLSVEQIDKLVELAVIAPKDKFDAVVKGIQLLVIGVACWAKKSLLEEEMLKEKQEYQQRNARRNQTEVDSTLAFDDD